MADKDAQKKERKRVDEYYAKKSKERGPAKKKSDGRNLVTKAVSTVWPGYGRLVDALSDK